MKICILWRKGLRGHGMKIAAAQGDEVEKSSSMLTPLCWNCSLQNWRHQGSLQAKTEKHKSEEEHRRWLCWNRNVFNAQYWHRCSQESVTLDGRSFEYFMLERCPQPMKIKGRVTGAVWKSCCGVGTEHTGHLDCCLVKLDTFPWCCFLFSSLFTQIEKLVLIWCRWNFLAQQNSALYRLHMCQSYLVAG